MTTIVTRAGKGSELTWNEVDANFNNLNASTGAKYYVASSGAVMDGTTDDGDVIKAWLDTLPAGATIEWPAGKTIVTTRAFGVQTGQTHIGYGCTLKRGVQVTTTLTGSSFATGTTSTITVASTTGFRVGQQIAVANAGRTRYSLLTVIVSIVPGTSITCSTTIQDGPGSSGSYAAGDTVATKNQFFTDISGVSLETGPADVSILGFNFDGNGANNSSIVRWETTHEISITGTSTNRLTVRDCRFKNAPGEGIYASVLNMKLDGLWFYWPASIAYGGNPIHCTGGASVTNKNFTVSNITVENSHQSGTGSGHFGGVITSSSDCKYGTFTNITALNVYALAGGIDVNGTGWQFVNCLVKSATTNAFAIQSGAVNVSFTGCLFEDCVDTTIASGQDCSFLNCAWINTPVTASSMVALKMIACEFRSTSTSSTLLYLDNSVDNVVNAVCIGGNVGIRISGSSTINAQVSGTVKNQLGTNPKGVYVASLPAVSQVTVSCTIIQETGVADSTVNGMFISGAVDMVNMTWRQTTGNRCIYASTTDPWSLRNSVIENANVSQYPIESGSAWNGIVIQNNAFKATDNGVTRWIYAGGGTVTKACVQGNYFYVGGSSYTIDFPTSVKSQYVGNVWGYKSGGNANTVTSADPLYIASSTTDQISGNLMRSAA